MHGAAPKNLRPCICRRIAKADAKVQRVYMACAAIYRIAPSRDRARARWRWIIPGAVGAGVIWMVASIAFSLYLENFEAYNATFGSLGAVAALLMWFWISAFSVCLGAALNAQLELFTTANTTIVERTRSGEHGAYVADHVESPEATVEDPVSLSKA
jgi:membrane protein